MMSSNCFSFLLANWLILTASHFFLSAYVKQLKKDTLDFIEGSIGSYPNIFVVVNHNDINDFFDMVANFEPNEYYFKKIQKFTISRDDKNFWKVYDWFQDEFYKTKPVESGLYDLNRYYRDVI